MGRHPALTSLLDRRQKQADMVEHLCSTVEKESRDFVDAELKMLDGYREQIELLDRQIKPLAALEEVTDAVQLPEKGPDTPAGRRRGAAQVDEPTPWRTAGEYLVDLVGSFANPLNEGRTVLRSVERITAHQERVLAQQVSGDTPGILPEPIIGQVMSDIDGMRPFVASLGVRPLGNVTGKVFNRPLVTQHTTSGAQTAELAELPSRKLVIDPVPFTKTTRGGSLLVSRQDIDWTDPGAWQILLDDLAGVYAEDTETVASVALASAVTQTEQRAGAGLQPLIDALYAAAVKVLTVGGTRPARVRRLPDVIWTSADMWAEVGAAIDSARAQVRPEQTGLGGGGLGTINGTILDLPRIMCPGMPAGTIIVGSTRWTEFYEERIGLLQQVAPAVLGVEIAHGGYLAYGTLDPTCFCKITAPIVAARTTAK